MGPTSALFRRCARASPQPVGADCQSCGDSFETLVGEMNERENTIYAVRCYEALLLSSRQLEQDREALRGALARELDYLQYARQASDVAAKLGVDTVTRL